MCGGDRTGPPIAHVFGLIRPQLGYVQSPILFIQMWPIADLLS